MLKLTHLLRIKLCFLYILKYLSLGRHVHVLVHDIQVIVSDIIKDSILAEYATVRLVVSKGWLIAVTIY